MSRSSDFTIPIGQWVSFEHIVPQLQEITFEIFTLRFTGMAHLRASVLTIWSGPTMFGRGRIQLSDGTRSELIGLFWSLLERGGPLLLEEFLEISLNRDHSAGVRCRPLAAYRLSE